MGCSQVSIVFLKMWYAKNVIIWSIIRSKSRYVFDNYVRGKTNKKSAYKECILHIANGVTACYLKITYRNRNIGSSFPLFLFTYFRYFLLCSRRIMCMRKSSKHPHKTLYNRTISSKKFCFTFSNDIKLTYSSVRCRKRRTKAEDS